MASYNRLRQNPLLYQAIVDQIERMVVSGDLEPGEILPSERELGVRFGVSRTAVREAMKVLAEKRLVTIVHGKGAVVIHPSSDTVTESLGLLVRLGKATPMQLTEVRRGIEPEMAALAATRATTEQAEAIEQLVEEHRLSQDDPERTVSLDIAFHRAVSEAAQNEVAKAVLDSIQQLFRESMAAAYRVEGAYQRSVNHHAQIATAIRARDPEAARVLMLMHLNSTAATLSKLDHTNDA